MKHLHIDWVLVIAVLATGALAILELGRQNHAWWADHPELQDHNTGDTAFNLTWEENYIDLTNLIKWQASQLAKGER